jgi:hypothetical protein
MHFAKRMPQLLVLNISTCSSICWLRRSSVEAGNYTTEAFSLILVPSTQFLGINIEWWIRAQWHCTSTVSHIKTINDNHVYLKIVTEYWSLDQDVKRKLLFNSK